MPSGKVLTVPKQKNSEISLKGLLNREFQQNKNKKWKIRIKRIGRTSKINDG